MKKPLLTMTALSALVLISPALQHTAAANKPVIRIAKPHIKVNVDTKRLTNKATTSKTGKGFVKAGPQPEPPTKPRPDFTRTTMIAPPLPRPRPLVVNADPKDDILAILGEPLPSTEPPREGEPESAAYDEFEEDEDGLSSDIDAPNKPELVLSDGFQDVFLTFGGVTPEFEFPEGAIPEKWGAGSGGNPFEDPGSLVRRPRFGEGMDGPPVAGGDAPGNGGKDRDGWRSVDHGGGSVRFERSNGNNTDFFGTNTNGGPNMTVEWGTADSDGNKTNLLLLEVDRTSGEWTLSKPNSEGDMEVIATGETEPGTIPPTDWDEDNDGAPDTDAGSPNADESGEEEPEDTTAGGGDQGAPNDNDTGRGTGGCGMWTPFGGCTGTGPKAWETTSQPNPTDDGSATVRSAGASIGPEAVTNGGDGSFGAEGNSGRGGGFGIDPCATVAGCGDGSGGPDNPVGSVDAAHAADR